MFGFRPVSNEKPGSHLPVDAPELEAVRTYIQSQVHSLHVHPRLVGNFDQVWSTTYRPQKKTWQKDISKRGMAKDQWSRSNAMRSIRHSIERSLDLTLTEDDPHAPKMRTDVRKPQVMGGPAASAVVDEWRVPRSATTLSFADGHVGRLFVSFREGTISQDVRERLNKELGKYMWIDIPHEKSHVWNQETLLRYLNFLAEERSSVLFRACNQYIYIYIYIRLHIYIYIVYIYFFLSLAIYLNI